MEKISLCIVAFGDRHRDATNAFILRHPGLEIYFASHTPLYDGQDNFIQISSSGYTVKVGARSKCKLENFLYLDCDTTIVPLNDLEFFTTRYDMCLAYDPFGTSRPILNDQELSPFELNTGVIY